MSNFSKMKKSRDSIEDLAKQLKNQGKKTYDKDERFWYPKRDENGNGYAIIRFLPPPADEEKSYVQTYRHGFQSKGGWYIEECPTTIGGDCPVCKGNGELYSTLGKEAAGRIVSGKNGRKRQMQYVANIVVISDPETPENEGKVFLYKFGAKVMGKIASALEPEFPDEVPINPFHMWNGANFTLKIKKVDGNANYDSSSFAKNTVLWDDDEAKMEATFDAEYSLAEFTAKERFKSYTELEARFNRVTGVVTTDSESDFTGKEHDPVETRVAEPAPQASEEDAANLDFFKGLVEEG